MTDVNWPEPQPDPDEERGEDPEFHLLPNLQRLRNMTPEERQELRRLVADWTGELVERWRERVASL
jgi:hypothetical protein